MGAVLYIVKVKDAVADVRGYSSFAVSEKVKVPTSPLEVEEIAIVLADDQEVIPAGIMPLELTPAPMGTNE